MSASKLTVAHRLHLGFGVLLAILAVVTLIAIFKVHAINSALHANSDAHLVIQRAAINFRGSAHNRSIAIRDVVLASTPEQRQKEEADIRSLADFYAQSAGHLEKLIAAPGASPELSTLYANSEAIDVQAVATTQAIVADVESGNTAAARSRLWEHAKPEYVAWRTAPPRRHAWVATSSTRSS